MTSADRGAGRLAPLIAIVGADGSGKSTVCAALAERLGRDRPIAVCHLGKKTGDHSRRLTGLPVIGGSIDRGLARNAGHSREQRGPGALAALAIYAISMRRVVKFRRMLALRRRGVTVLADRYPQTAVLSSKADGPLLLSLSPRSRIARALARRERRLYEWMASFPPDLVIRLEVDLATAVRRKPNHRPDSLAKKIEAIGQARYGEAPIVAIDSRLPLEEVVSRAHEAAESRLPPPPPARGV